MELFPEKAQYLKNEEVILCVETDGAEIESCILRIFCLEEKIEERKIKCIPSRERLIIHAGSYESNFSGYGVQVILKQADGTNISLETAFDVVETAGKSLRYGFLSDFENKDAKNDSVSQLRKYHINMVQFYDWSYRHDNLVSEKNQYLDMMGKRISLDTVKEKICQAKRMGMKSIAYGAVYAASAEFYKNHRTWAFYNANHEVFRFIDIFYIMNIAKDSPWRKHLIEEYKKAIEKVGFSGIHMDTYGFPKTAYSHLDAGEEERVPYNLIHLDKEFPGLIDEVRDGLEKRGVSPYLIFNNVGNWPVEDTASAGVDAVYIEVWQPYERYFHIKQLIENARRACKDEKPVILAAYLEPFRKESQSNASYALRILTAVIVSNGAYHLIMGEKNGVLTQGYYGDYSLMEEETAEIMRRYYDFMIRYMNLFYEKSFTDVSMTHMGWDNYEYRCNTQNIGTYGESGKIWITIRENEQYKCLYLINLCGNIEDYWNRGKQKPAVQSDITFTVGVDKRIQGVYTASPDDNSTESIELEYTYAEDEKGMYVRFTVREILVWRVVYLKV